MPKARLESWVVSDAFWERVVPLIPQPPGRPRRRKFARKPGGGRKPKDARVVFEAIVYGVAYRLPMESTAERALRQRQCHPQAIPGMGQGRVLRRAVASGVGRVRRYGGHRLAMAEHRRGITEGTAGARVGRAQPHRPGEKMGASECCWSTPVASRCRSS